MAYADQQMGGNKVVSIVIVAVIHVAIGYLLISGLAISAAKKIVERVTTIDVEEPPPPPDEPPPPEQPRETAPPPPVAPPPPISVAVAPPQIQTQQTIPPPAPPAVVIPPPAPVAPPAPPPPPSQARGASTKNERSWAARIQENYPTRALNEERSGTVGLRVTVTPQGKAANCQVTSSSGHNDLDQAACRGMERYAQFNPALDDAGNPTSGSYSTRITYRLN
jgi:periplasmic protein TonB